MVVVSAGNVGGTCGSGIMSGFVVVCPFQPSSSLFQVLRV